jgi:hydroxyacylglutathione hydrolase
MQTQIIPIPLLQDNYAYLVHEKGKTLVIDPSEGPPVRAALEERGWKADAVLNTHHHWDHVGGNAALKAEYGCLIWGPEGDKDRVPSLDKELPRDRQVEVAEVVFETLFIPGHTHHHQAFYFPLAKAVFSGDTLFLMGCGRLFEGTPEQMWKSLGRLASLPSQTRVFCGHEYTRQNALFALSLEPEWAAVKARLGCHVPGTIEEELKTNPFLRLKEGTFREKFFPGSGEAEAFAQMRKKKDSYRN